MSTPLVVLLGESRAGVIEQGEHGRLRFTYDEAWRRDERSLPLSLSMPLALASHEKAVEPYLQGLLPDNDDVLRRWGSRFHVSHRNAFALLRHVGEDCAGAVRFVAEERVPEARSSAWTVDWISEEELGRRLGNLSTDRAAWRERSDTGQFSLAGAQPKTALLRQDGRWGVPSGKAPTTHILKPPIPGFDGHVENEHLCLQLARELGLPAAASEVLWFDGRIAIAVERYDRVRSPGDSSHPPILRVHQEDVCQALGISPRSKYQNEGGPSPEDVIELLRRSSSSPVEDVRTFVRALAFNWLIAGTDAHAKNYSILLGEGGSVRLAPLYDLASALPYEDMEPQRIKLAMKIGGKYRIRDIGVRAWRQLASRAGLHSDELLGWVESCARRMPAAMARVRERAHGAGLDHPIVEKLSLEIQRRAQETLGRLRLDPASDEGECP